jgi:Ca2+-binding EF-hand superfamily protein
MDQFGNESQESGEKNICTERHDGNSIAEGMCLSEQSSVFAEETFRKSMAAESLLPDFELFDSQAAVASMKKVSSNETTKGGECKAEGGEPAAPVCGGGDTPEPLMDTEGVKAVMEKHFDRIDKDRDGYLSQTELDKAMEDKCITGKDAQVLAAVREHREPLQDMSDDEIGFENDGITRNDFSEIDRQTRDRRQSLKQTDRVCDHTAEAFDKLDSDRDGFLTTSEVDKALADPSLASEDREKLESLKSLYEILQSSANDEWGIESKGVSRADLDAHRQATREDQTNKKILDLDLTLFSRGKKLQESNHKLYGDATDPLDSISVDAITQGNSGDCTFIAATAALARVDREAITRMIQDNHDGTYTVTFPGDPSHPVTIDAPTDAELASYATGGKNGTWPAVLEKAYGKYRNAEGIGAENAADSNADTVLALMTGKQANRQSPEDLSTEELERIFTNRDNYPMTAGLYGEGPFTDGKDDETGLPRNHAYIIAGYDANTKEVILRNPQGEGEPQGSDGKAKDGQDNGVFRMSLSQFQKKFDRLSHTTKR